MELKDKKAWEETVRINTDPYGKATVDYAEAWADLMEKRMVGGEKLEKIAKQASHDADTDGITGFMYGCAVGFLSGAWVHGEQLRQWQLRQWQLRQWHNLDSQIRDEGEKANEKGTVLNPALLMDETK